MVTTEDEKVFGVFDLVGQKKAYGLKGLLASVYIVTQEEVVCLWGETTIFEEAQQIVVLSMNIAANLDEKISVSDPYSAKNTKC